MQLHYVQYLFPKPDSFSKTCSNARLPLEMDVAFHAPIKINASQIEKKAMGKSGKYIGKVVKILIHCFITYFLIA